MVSGSYTTRLNGWLQGALRAAAYVTAGLLAFGLTGCAAAHLASSAGYAALSSMEDGEAGLIELRLRTAEAQWHGAPYRWGGLSRDGVDCSGFVMNVYEDVFDVPLPRTTTAQVKAGQAVPTDALQAGDLVFFRTSRRARHVGIYLGEGEFAHASTSRGVMTSRLDDAYWQRTYWTARRILPAVLTQTAHAAPPPLQPMKPRPPSRTGW